MEPDASAYHLIARPTPVWVSSQVGRRSLTEESHSVEDKVNSNAQRLKGYKPPESRVQIKDASRWLDFVSTTTRPNIESGGFIDEKALEKQYDFSDDWMGTNDSDVVYTRSWIFWKKRRQKTIKSHEPYSLSSARYFVSEESRKTWKPRLTVILLNNPLVPLTLRAIIFILSVIALGLACSVYVHSRHALPTAISQQPSTIMAIAAQSTALVYLVYITYDEYSGKPIGLREPKAKMRLIMLDLLFIIFSSANLSLTFNTLFDVTWTCNSTEYDDPQHEFSVPFNSPICARQKSLATFLFMILVMWVSTFTISIFRLVERVSQA